MRMDRNRQLFFGMPKNIPVGRGQREESGRVGSEGGATLPCQLPSTARFTSQPQDLCHHQAPPPPLQSTLRDSTVPTAVLTRAHTGLSGPISPALLHGPSAVDKFLLATSTHLTVEGCALQLPPHMPPQPCPGVLVLLFTLTPLTDADRIHPYISEIPNLFLDPF